MKVLSVVTGYPPAVGGAQVHAHYLNKTLAGRHQVRVACQWAENRTDWLRGTTLDAPAAKTYEQDGIPVSLISPTPQERRQMAPWVWAYYPLQGWAVERIAAVLAGHLEPLADGAEIVHNVRMGREGLSFAALQVARRKGIPFVLTPLHHPRWGTWLHRHYQRLYREADGLLALTEAERRTLVALGAAPEKVSVVGHGPVLAESADGEEFRRSYGLEGPLVLFLGQKYRYKGVGSLLGAAEAVWGALPETHFAFIGPRTRYSRRLFAGLSDPRLLELGTVDLETKTAALLAADVLCVPSTQESFGGVFLEAWMCGLPVVGGECAAAREVVADGRDGFVVRPEPAAIAPQLLRLLRDPGLGRQMAAAGREKVEERYTWEKVAARVEGAYHRALDERGKGAENAQPLPGADLRPAARVNVLGVGVSAINMPQALSAMEGWVSARAPNYVCVTPAHGVMDCRRDPGLRRIFNSSGLTTPDGMAIVWLLWLHGQRHVERVYGPDLMLAACEFGLERGWRHYFYGGEPGVAAALVERLGSRLPGLQVAGFHSPPFRPLTSEEDQAVVQWIRAARPDVLWVGISTPKQERWMSAHLELLDVPVLVGVGAAFDFLSGRKRQAPRWVQRGGLEWLFRLATEPRRLWRRYASYPLFALLATGQLLGLKRYEM